MNNFVKCNVYNLSANLTGYADAWRYQKAAMEAIHNKRKQKLEVNNSLFIVQHPSIYTLGRGATLKNIKFQPGNNSSSHEVVRVERGGEVTWHGPGQLVAYPLFDLNQHKKDLHWFATSLEQTVINVLNEQYSISGERSSVNTGVWVGKNKIGAIGVTASRWITMHGMALNVNCELSHFEQIVPCGIAVDDRGVCSIQSIVQELCPSGAAVDTAHVAREWISSFANVFNMEMNIIHDAVRPLDALLTEYPEIAALHPQRILSLC